MTKPKFNLDRCLIPAILSAASKKLLGVGVLNFSFEFLKTSYNSDFRISGLKLLHY